jgi:hypothetical protein
MQKFILILLGTALLNACGDKPDPAKEANEKIRNDSVIVAEKIRQKAEEKKKNPFLIEPPDTAYTGDYLDKYDNGNVKFQGFFRFGKRHGQWMAFYGNGILWSECFYDKGLRSGANNVYFENGKPHYKGWFKNDLRDSVWTFYNEEGKEVQKVKFKNDEEVPLKDGNKR